MKATDRIQLFAMANQIAERELDLVESAHSLELGRDSHLAEDRDEQFYPQFREEVRREAAEMASHYEVFYCLERSMRELVQAKLEAELGADWWEKAVPNAVKENVKKNIQRERDFAVTRRSDRDIDYTTFGELGEIVRHNWNGFADTFNSRGGFDKVIAVLNVLRGPIAHCTTLAPDEIVRLRLAMADWFRLMG